MKYFVVLKYFIHVEVTRSPDGFYLCQRNSLDIISEVGLLGVKPANLPMEQNHRVAFFASILLAWFYMT